MNVDTISILVEKGLKEKEMNDCFLVETKVNNTKIEVFLDSDEQVSFAKCRVISRYLEEIFDEKQWFGEKYTLEVSSAGVGRPLTLPRQYIKNIGRKIEIKTVSGNKFKGTLSTADDENATIEWEEKEKVGKKKVIVEKSETVSYDQIKEAKIKVSFK